MARITYKLWCIAALECITKGKLIFSTARKLRRKREGGVKPGERERFEKCYPCAVGRIYLGLVA